MNPAAAPASDSPARPSHRPWLILAALVIWPWTTFSHAFGRGLAGDYFAWAETRGVLHADGGLAGVSRAELILAAVFGAIVVVAVGATLRRLRGLERDDVIARVLTWLLWAAVAHLVWKCLIVFATELAHFAQYGLIAALLCAGIDRGRRPQVAFLVATALGVLDEAWQHYGLALVIDDNLRHGFDWSDLILNATGACGGALAVASSSCVARPVIASSRLLFGTVALLSAVLLPLVLLDGVTLARMFGWYHYHPFWHHLEYGKPVHWMTPYDGIPLFVASVLLLGLVLAPQRALVARSAMLALLVLVNVGIRPPSRREPRPLHEDVPHAQGMRVDDSSITVDGVLDEAAWAGAPRIGPFVSHVHGRPEIPVEGGGLVPLAPTFARIVWDADALYVAFEVSDGDVWARAVERDEPTLPGDEVVEVFVDPDGDEITYYEFEFSSLNVQYDLFNVIPQPPMDHNAWAPFIGLADWDADDVRSAVTVQGTLDVVEKWKPSDVLDEDTGWTVEIRIPWRVFRTTTTPSGRSFMQLPPDPGQRWRIGLYRVERPRVSPVDGTSLSRKEARDHQQLQAWSHTLIDGFHVPSRFGVVEFVDER